MTTTKPMDKTFNHQAFEEKLTQEWQDAGYFCPQTEDKPYCIMLPPPNVTGHLHMGHGFQLSLMDALIRYHHMKGHSTLWQAGTDHAGIATQMVVETQLKAQNQSKESLGRDAFTEKVWAWKEHAASTIQSQLKRMGAALDWEHECFTLDPAINLAVNQVFVQLYDEGLIYRDKRLVNWDPVLQTAVSDLEVESINKQGQLWHINYPLQDSNQTITIATTRPETMLGDTAVAVHPDDSRYQSHIGKSIILPISQRIIPIIADDSVDPEFGTGAVKITPAHDFNDYDIGKRHNLPMITILEPDGTLNANTPANYQGLSCKEARKLIVEELEQLKVLKHTEPHQHQVPTGDRSGAIIEPMLTDQWFMSMESLAKPAIAAVQNGDIRFTPANWEKTYFQWLDNIQDWCLSRQLWWGHRIPAWYDPDGHAYVGLDEQHVREKYKLDQDIPLKQDDDVLDTWFSSALWPFVTLGWPEKTKRFETFYPTNVLVTGFDIIFFWVARMVMMGLKLTDQVPFKQVYITGLIRDSHGEKMSKSKGNVLDPIDLIQGIDLDTLMQKRTQALMQSQIKQKIEAQTRKEFPHGLDAYGTDALRFTYCALANTSRDINFDVSRLEGYRNFCNKLWNATRYVLLQTEDYQHQGMPNQFSATDQWLLQQRDLVIEQVEKHFEQFRFDLIAKTLYEFTWHSTCDWALEFSKITLQDPSLSDEQRYACQTCLLMILADILRLLHPIMPFITDAIWPNIANKLELSSPHLLKEVYPHPGQYPFAETHSQVQKLQKIITAIRTIRSEMNVSPKQIIDTIFLISQHHSDQEWLNNYLPWLKGLGKCQQIEWLSSPKDNVASVSAVAETITVYVPLEGLIDKATEIAKIQKNILKLDTAIKQCQSKLNNANYCQNAPADVVQKEQDKCTQLQHEHQQYQQQLTTIQAIPD